MQQAKNIRDHQQATEVPRTLRRLLYLACAFLLLLLLVLLPPLISVNRYQHRIAASISASLGRPVHLDKVTLNLLPLPGFTLENFVVDEDPAFGSEPVIRANSVRATLRISSLWRHRVEFSTISFTEPSVNLVHTSNGKWNLDTILLHAAHIEAAPTAQRSAGPAPRFPYIEASGARLNLKLDNEKTPISLTDADFALWLPEPQQWHLRLSAHPARTDTDASDTGLLEVEGTLGRAASLEQVPVNLRGLWHNAPLGGASLILLGRDAGLRGNLTLSANVQGTVGYSTMQTRLQLAGARRAEFVPSQPLDIDIQCLGTATSAFYSFRNIHCSWPPAGSSEAPLLSLSAALPDIRHAASVSLSFGTPGLPVATLLDWLRVASSRVPPDLTAAGTLTGNLFYGVRNSASGEASSPQWSGNILIDGARLVNPSAGTASLITGNIDLHSIQPLAPGAERNQRSTAPDGTYADRAFFLSPISLALGGKDPAILEGRFDTHGYALHLTGMASISRLKAFAEAIPPLSDNLADALPTNRADGPFRVDLTATRTWRSPQVWTDATRASTPHRANPSPPLVPPKT
ncbi:MAG: AsmA family protein [Acidobacteriota bacterium]|nr:AsmA family protein [Acidobacteriota bacterium]